MPRSVGWSGAPSRSGRAVRLALAFAGFLMVVTASASAADVVTLTPDRDNTLFEDAAGSLSNGTGPVVFAGNNGQDLARRALLRFDVAGSVPYGARIDAAELRLNCSNAANSILRTFTLHRILRDWGEGASSTTSGSGALAATGDATWLHTFYPTSTWTAAGGDFAVAASATLSVGDVGVYTWTGTGMKADVQEWLNDSAPNFGWLLLGEETTLNTARRFDSRENAVVANRPVLTVHYSLNTVGVEPGAGAAAARLEGPIPNPARGECRFGFVLPAGARVRVEVDDVAGRHVATLAEDWFGPGRSEARWDEGSSLRGTVAPGLYFCRLFVDGRLVATRAVVQLH